MAITKVTSGLISADASSIDLNIDAGTLYLDVSENKVGIGTSSPNTRLTVGSGSGTEVLTILAGTSGESQLRFADGTSGSAAYQGRVEYDHANSLLNLGAGGGTQVTIDSSGNVGIGTTSPTSYYSGADNLVVHQSSGEAGMTIATANNTTGALYFADGTSGSEAYQGGIAYSHGAEILNLVSGGSNKMTIDSSGNVGIGTTSPARELDIQAASGWAELALRGASGSAGSLEYYNASTKLAEIYADTSTNIIFRNSTGGTTERMRIDSSGDVRLAANATGAALLKGVSGNQTSRNVGGYPQFTFVGNEGTGMRRPITNILAFDTSGDERMRIDDSGGVLIGKTSGGSTNTGCEFGGGGTGGLAFNITSTNECFTYNNNNSSGATYLIDFRQNNTSKGQIQVSSTSTTYATSSDYRLKENVDYDFTALDRVAQLKPARFNFIADADTTVDGFLAHEVQDIVPEAIHGEKDAVDSEGNPEYQGIDQSKLVPLLTKAIQEQQTIIDNLKTRIETLESA